MDTESIAQHQKTVPSPSQGPWAWLLTQLRRFRQPPTMKATSSTSATEVQDRSSEAPTAVAGSISDDVASIDEFEDLTLPPLRLHLIKRPDQLLEPPVYELALKMLKSSPLADVKGAMLELADGLHHPQVALLAVQEGDDWPCMALMQTGQGLVKGATVLHFFCDGSARARKHLVDALLVFARWHKAERILGIDMNDKTQAFTRLFKALGPAKTYGHLVEFDISEAP